MAEKNILLGNGEALTSSSKINRPRGGKNYPYSLSEVTEAIAPALSEIQKSASELPREAKPRGEAVFEITLHPAFLARSYYPVKLLEKSNLRDIGSKETTVIPRKVTDKREEGKKQATATLLVAGNDSAIATLKAFLEAEKLAKNIEKDLKEIESLRWIKNTDKIKGIIEHNDIELSFEVALHAGADEEDIVISFADFVKNVGGKADLRRRLKVGRLTFIPVYATGNQIYKIANHSFLRVVRVMPELRMAPANMARSSFPNYSNLLPAEPAVKPDTYAAIFDGGLGTQDLSPWAREYYYDDTDETVGQLLMHGN